MLMDAPGLEAEVLGIADWTLGELADELPVACGLAVAVESAELSPLPLSPLAGAGVKVGNVVWASGNGANVVAVRPGVLWALLVGRLAAAVSPPLLAGCIKTKLKAKTRTRTRGVPISTLCV